MKIKFTLLSQFQKEEKEEADINQLIPFKNDYLFFLSVLYKKDNFQKADFFSILFLCSLAPFSLYITLFNLTHRDIYCKQWDEILPKARILKSQIWPLVKFLFFCLLKIQGQRRYHVPWSFKNNTITYLQKVVVTQKELGTAGNHVLRQTQKELMFSKEFWVAMREN